MYVCVCVCVCVCVWNIYLYHACIYGYHKPLFEGLLPWPQNLTGNAIKNYEINLERLINTLLIWRIKYRTPRRSGRSFRLFQSDWIRVFYTKYINTIIFSKPNLQNFRPLRSVENYVAYWLNINYVAYWLNINYVTYWLNINYVTY